MPSACQVTRRRNGASILSTAITPFSQNSDTFSLDLDPGKNSSPPASKTLATVVRGLHTHNACDISFCWFSFAASASPLPPLKSALKAFSLPVTDFITGHPLDRLVLPESFDATGMCPSCVRMRVSIPASTLVCVVRPRLLRSGPMRVQRVAAGVM